MWVFVQSHSDFDFSFFTDVMCRSTIDAIYVLCSSTGSRVALKGVALLSATPKLRSAKGVPLILLRLSGNRSGTQYFVDL